VAGSKSIGRPWSGNAQPWRHWWPPSPHSGAAIFLTPGSVRGWRAGPTGPAGPHRRFSETAFMGPPAARPAALSMPRHKPSEIRSGQSHRRAPVGLPNKRQTPEGSRARPLSDCRLRGAVFTWGRRPSSRHKTWRATGWRYGASTAAALPGTARGPTQGGSRPEISQNVPGPAGATTGSRKAFRATRAGHHVSEKIVDENPDNSGAKRSAPLSSMPANGASNGGFHASNFGFFPAAAAFTRGHLGAWNRFLSPVRKWAAAAGAKGGGRAPPLYGPGRRRGGSLGIGRPNTGQVPAKRPAHYHVPGENSKNPIVLHAWGPGAWISRPGPSQPRI